METKKIHNPYLQNTTFGALMGLSFVITSYAYYRAGQNISLNPHLNNVITLLMIIGTFIGVWKHRQENLGGYITYGKALAACIYLITIASVIYGIYIGILYHNNPELLQRYATNMQEIFQQVYGNTPYIQNLQQIINIVSTPTVIAFSEIFNKIIFGTVFSLFLAGILRKKTTPNQN